MVSIWTQNTLDNLLYGKQALPSTVKIYSDNSILISKAHVAVLLHAQLKNLTLRQVNFKQGANSIFLQRIYNSRSLRSLTLIRAMHDIDVASAERARNSMLEENSPGKFGYELLVWLVSVNADLWRQLLE